MSATAPDTAPNVVVGIGELEVRYDGRERLAAERAVLVGVDLAIEGSFGDLGRILEVVAQFLAGDPNRPAPPRDTIVIQPIGTGDVFEGMLPGAEEIVDYVGRFFGLNTELRPPITIDGGLSLTLAQGA